MTPCADTVGLVNNKTSELAPVNESSDNALDRAAHSEHFWRDINDLGVGIRPGELLVGQVLVSRSEITRIGDGRNVPLDQVSRLVIDK